MEPPERKTSARPGKTTARNRSAKVENRERPRGGPARSIADLMPEIGRAAFRRFGFIQSSVVTRWPEIVGEAHARICRPEQIRFPAGQRAGGVLHLVAAGAHAPLLAHIEGEIIERVNRFFGYGAVSGIRIRHGALPALPAALGAADPGPPRLRPVPLDLGDSLRDIGDPELLAVLEGVARSLARRKDADGGQPAPVQDRGGKDDA